MVLTKEIKEKILDFVKEEPRSIQEIARFLQKNWRTAERYVMRLKEEYDEIKIKIFRKGSRGALKIVYWQPIIPFESEVKDWLFKRIEVGIRKEDFSFFDIFQFIDEKKKKAFVYFTESVEKKGS